MNIKRMQLLRDVLADVVAFNKAFEMDKWVNATATDKITCGTASCALGWLVRDPRGQAEGLGFRLALDSVWLMPTYDGEIDTGERFFDIDRHTASWLFIPDYYRDEDDEDDENDRPVTIDEVIERVDWLLAGHSVAGFQSQIQE
jgi:hypothetical protein